MKYSMNPYRFCFTEGSYPVGGINIVLFTLNAFAFHKRKVEKNRENFDKNRKNSLKMREKKTVNN